MGTLSPLLRKVAWVFLLAQLTLLSLSEAVAQSQQTEYHHSLIQDSSALSDLYPVPHNLFVPKAGNVATHRLGYHDTSVPTARAQCSLPPSRASPELRLP